MSEKSQNQNEETKINSETQILTRKIEFPAGKHIWRQQGPYVVCQNCPLHHAVFVGMDKVMVGENEDGKPILRDRASI